MRQGRLLKLFMGSEHVQIGDPWITAFVYVERAIGLALIAAFALAIGLAAAGR